MLVLHEYCSHARGLPSTTTFARPFSERTQRWNAGTTSVQDTVTRIIAAVRR
ncbi:hypothetical protein [Kitasatospora sp. NPDC092286]|uniref:hypothetical protein n=1 Tax=Kitasatospora sp. NPDC092286 TaxID=3364087 RepID=UPI0038070461